MKKSWVITDSDDIDHRIEVRTGLGCKLVIDGNIQQLKFPSWHSRILDHAFELGGSELHLIIVGSQAFLSVNGEIQELGIPYEPIQIRKPGFRIIWTILFVGCIWTGWMIANLPGMLVGIFLVRLSGSYMLKHQNYKNGVGRLLVAYLAGCLMVRFFFWLLLKIILFLSG